MKKAIKNISKLAFKQSFPGLNGVDIMASNYPIEPFLVFTEFYMERPVFGPHPHAGVSVMTYMLPDSKQGFINRDSLGDFSYIEPGGIHISQAGMGMFHDEFPKHTGIETHGFQIWINHKLEDRYVAPASMHANADEIIESVTTDYRLRIVHGEFNGKHSPYKLMTNVNLYHIFLYPNKTIEFEAQEMAFVYGLKGNGMIEDREVAEQTLVNFGINGNKVSVNAHSNGFEFMYATGQPINEPIVYGGPFVMTTKEQMSETQKRLATGKMGKLEPYIRA